MRARFTSGGAGDTFDRFAYGTGRASAFGESEEDEWQPIALPRESAPMSDLHAGDLVVRRALGDEQLGFFHVLGQDISPQSLYDTDGRMRADTMVLRPRMAPRLWTNRRGRRVLAAVPGQARRSAGNHRAGAGGQVQDGAKIAQRVSANGLFEIPLGTSTKATHSVAYRGGTYRSYVRWRPVTGTPAVLTPGKPHTIEISSRLRLSLWAFTPPLTRMKSKHEWEIDSAQVQLLKDANVDDLSLVWTVTWDARRKPTDPAKPPVWDHHLKIRGGTDEQTRVRYLKEPIAALHPKVQVIAGFDLVGPTPGKKETPTRPSRTTACTRSDSCRRSRSRSRRRA